MRLVSVLLALASAAGAGPGRVPLAVDVRDASGQPVANAHVRVVQEPDSLEGSTDTRGSVTLTGVHPTKRLELWCTAPGFALSIQVYPTPPSGASVILQRTASVHGLVRDESGAPLAGAAITIDRDHHALTDGHGHFAIAGLNPQDYLVNVTAPGYEPEVQGISPDPAADEDLGVITLRRAAPRR